LFSIVSENSSQNIQENSFECIPDCPVECVKETFLFDKIGSSGGVEYKVYEVYYPTSIVIKRESREENIYYLPALSFTSYLCSIGGILSMWFGISVFGEGKRIFNFILAIKLRLLNHSKNNYHKILKCFKFL